MVEGRWFSVEKAEQRRKSQVEKKADEKRSSEGEFDVGTFG